ncbi:hypothetical protein CEXT_186831 [Caerostris extrusa]|uniref:Secreted protein n=1 Tax=Caerostris extrusa TaxID=172846 RepID=A0AAV4X4R5_CAEEX|nr:hypothetical protein CEXT_186831 [Caerostris extrusa]
MNCLCLFNRNCVLLAVSLAFLEGDAPPKQHTSSPCSDRGNKRGGPFQFPTMELQPLVTPRSMRYSEISSPNENRAGS